MDSESLSDFFEQYEFDETNLIGGSAVSPEDIFRVLEGFEDIPPEFNLVDKTEFINSNEIMGCMISHKSSGSGSSNLPENENENEVRESTLMAPKCKRQKVSAAGVAAVSSDVNPDGQQKMAHITVERNRRKQMNEHLTILRSLMPCFYVKRGDQASVIGGVVNYISELQQVLQSLESKKQRKIFSEVLSPRIISPPNLKPSPLSPHKPPLSPRLNLPISPRTPPSNTTSPYKPRLLPALSLLPLPLPPSSTTTSSVIDSINELVANSKSAIAEVEVKFSGANVLLQTVSCRLPGQAVKIIASIHNLSLEILQVNISTFEETMIMSFTIKIGIECELSADELAQLVQQTFC